MNKQWQTGHITPWWNQEHRDLDFLHENFNNADDVRKWHALGFTQKRFTGDMYDMRRQEPDWLTRFRDHFAMPHFSWSVYRMRPGDVLPEHGDTYRKFCELYDIDDINKIQRYVVFMEDWSSGHYFEIDRTAVTAWRAGTWVSWWGDTPHIAANLGTVPRYTLQITGCPSQEAA